MGLLGRRETHLGQQRPRLGQRWRRTQDANVSHSTGRRCRDQTAAAAGAQQVESVGSSSCGRVQSWKARLTLRKETPASQGAPVASASAGAASAAQWIPRLGDEGCLSWNRADPAISGWSFAKVLGAH